jgi:hypothetical protein
MLDNNESKKAEMVIPDAVDQLIQTSTLTCTVIDSSDPWQ